MPIFGLDDFICACYICTSITDSVLGFNGFALARNWLNGLHECSRLRAWHSDCTKTAFVGGIRCI